MTAIDRLTAFNQDTEATRRELAALNDQEQQLRRQLADLEAETADARGAMDAATAALTAALTSGDPEAVAKARNQAAGARKDQGKADMARLEADALKAAIQAVQAKAAPLATLQMSRREQSKDLTADRLSEYADEVTEKYRAALQHFAATVAEAQALWKLCLELDRPSDYAPPPFVMPAVVGENIGKSGRVVIDLAPLRQMAYGEAIDRLKSEGFPVTA